MEGPPQFFLKQFRSIKDGQLASQQQITKAGVTMNRIKGWELLGEFDYSCSASTATRSPSELGLRDQTTSLAFAIEVDFMLENGHALWQGPCG